MRHVSLILAALVLVLGAHTLSRAEEPKATGAQSQKWEYRLLVYDLWAHEEDEDAAYSRAKYAEAGWYLVPKGQNLAAALKAAGDEGWELAGSDQGRDFILKRPKR